MTIAMLALIRVCVQVNKKDFQPVGGSAKEKVFSGKSGRLYIERSSQCEVHTLTETSVARGKISVMTFDEASLKLRSLENQYLGPVLHSPF